MTMTTPVDQLARAAAAITGAQLKQQQHAKQVAGELAAQTAAARQQAPAAPEPSPPAGQ